MKTSFLSCFKTSNPKSVYLGLVLKRVNFPIESLKNIGNTFT